MTDGPGRSARTPSRIYAVDPWQVREVGLNPADLARGETVFTLANGQLGLRGSLEESTGSAALGTYLNGFHEEMPIVYGEAAPAFARNHQVLVSVADGKRIRLEVDGEPLDPATGTVELHERTLDLRTGVLSRRLRWRSPGGRRVEVASRRLVSLARRGVAVIDYEVTLLGSPGGTARLRLESRLDAASGGTGVSDDPRVATHLPEGSLALVRSEADATGGGLVAQRTRVTGLAVATAVRHGASLLPGPAAGDPPDVAIEAGATPGGVSATVTADLRAGDRLRLVKTLGYASSLDLPEDRLAPAARALAEAAMGDGAERLAAEQTEVLDSFWHASDVEIEGDPALQQSVRFNLFSVFQSAGRDGRTGLAAKGLTGEGYAGHYFWDTEVFALPLLAYTQPAIARALLAFRIRTLPQARERAAEMSERGALFPWRTINGREASAYFPAGTAQYHINADIALALVRYVRVTGDRSLLLEGGAELLFETARLWLSLGGYIGSRGDEFCINGVTGPDEYTALVDNNAYTNLMARAHLRHAVRVAAELEREQPAAFARIAGAIGLGAGELDDWTRAADRMRIPRDPALGVHAQDDSFLGLERWDFAGTPSDHYPLLLHYHPLVIYRHQVLKQSDVVLAQVLLAHDFTLAEKRRNYDYYDPLTTGDSSLSPCVQSVAAAELGYAEDAYRYLVQTARMDLDDINGNVSHGVHIAAMAGSWMAVVYGLAGLRDDDGGLAFAPRPPAGWRRLAFRLAVGGSLLRVSIGEGRASYALEAGPPLALRHFGEPAVVEAGRPAVFDLRPRLRAVVFDLDGVITDTAELHYLAWRRLADEESIPFDREFNERLKGVSRHQSLEIILERAGRGAEDPQAKRAMAERKNAYFRELIANVTPADLLPGIGGLLDELHAAGVRTAIASMSHNVFEVVHRLGIEPLIDQIVDPAGVVRGKPDPEIFLTAAELLGVRPADCVGIEDAQVGVEAIRTAGMAAVGVGRRLAGADWVVADTRQLTLASLGALLDERGRPGSETPADPTSDRARR